MIITTFKDSKSSSLANFLSGLFYRLANNPVIIGSEKATPILNVSIKAGGNRQNIIFSFYFKFLLNCFNKSSSISDLWLEIFNLTSSKNIISPISKMKIEVQD